MTWSPPKLPWLLPYRSLLLELGADPFVASPAEFGARCNAFAAARELPFRFVRSRATRRTSANDYEARIVSSGEIEMRETLHDALNALVWLRFPIAKRAISGIHVADAKRSPAGPRTRRRDAATLFDEHGAVFLARDAAWFEDVREHRWSTLWIDRRAAFTRDTSTVVFGHGLLARLYRPHRALSAHALPMRVDDLEEKLPSDLDVMLAEVVARVRGPGDLLALPVMGLPGWSAGQDGGFYADTTVFRSLTSVVQRRSPAVTDPP